MKEELFSYLDLCINENKMAHAFLIETNNIEKSLNDIINYLFKNKIIKFIDISNNLNTILIEPEGKDIKTSSVELLHNRFATTPIVDKYNIYFIKSAEKMNISAANKLLKFLEEPADYIVGFLFSDSNSKVMDTVRSRCQIFKMEYPSQNSTDIETKEALIKYIKNQNYEDQIALKSLIINKERSELITIFQDMIEFLEKQLTIEPTELESILSNIVIFDNILHLLKSNVNIELIFDKLCLELR